MPEDRYSRIRELFEAARALPEARRDAFLRQAAPDEPAMRDEVRSLLDAAPGADSFLESSPLASRLRAGSRIGHFDVIEMLGRGGMGEVYRARDSRLNRHVAIKVLPPGLSRDPDRIARFEREARAASALNHPNIIAVYDIGRDDETYWIATELVPGESLASVVERGPLPARKAIEIASQVAAGLAAAHTAGIIHRDLKPANIMVARDGRAKILDFGLAKQSRPSADSTTLELTNEGTVMGTAGYMSPEQVRAEAVDHRSDLFSFGVIVYEMLCGKRAFAGNSSIEVMNAILREDPPELPSSVPPSLDHIVRRCLEKDRERRFQTAADLAFALDTSLTSAPRRKTPIRKRWLKWAALALVLSAAGVVYRFMPRSHLAASLATYDISRVTVDPGLTRDPVISADGKLIAYTSDRKDSSNLDIWVQQVDGGATFRITDDPHDDYDPSFSPDATQIAFRSERDGGGIYLVATLGGNARLLVPRGSRPKFSPDGTMLMYRDPGNRLFIAHVGGMDQGNGVAIATTSGRADGTLVFPKELGVGCSVESSAVWSPDSRFVLFSGACGSEQGRLWVSTPDGKRVANSKLEQVLRPFSWELNQWVGNPSRLLVSSWKGPGGGTIYAVPVSADGVTVTGPAQTITFGRGADRQASAASNGLIAFSEVNKKTQIWAVPIDGTGHATGAERQLIPGSDLGFPTLSRDGKKMAFTSRGPAGPALYCRDLASGQEWAIPNAGFDSGNPLFSPDTSRIIFFQNTGGWQGFVTEAVITGGPPKKLWGDNKTAYLLWDWSPDGSTVLLSRSDHLTSVQAMDLKSLSSIPVLDDPEYSAWNANFTRDERWVTFNAVKDGNSRVYAAPFRKALVPRSEWTPITDGALDDKPHLSSDAKLIFFSSDRDGFRCIWAQKLGSDMHPAGAPFAVYHSHERRRSLSEIGIVGLNIAVGPGMIAFNRAESEGNIWLLHPAGSGAQ